MTKYLLLSIGVTVVLILGFMIDVQSRTPVMRPSQSLLNDKIYAVGRIEAATPEIELRGRQGGRIAEILVQEGQTVEAGEVLLRIEDGLYREEVNLAAAELGLAKASLEHLINGAHPHRRVETGALYRAKLAEYERAKLSWQRINKLVQDDAVSQQKADDQRTLLDALAAEVEAAKARMEYIEAPARADEVKMEEARVKAAQAKLELAKVRLKWAELRAPISGQILKIDVEPGELIGPDTPRPAVVMADTSRFLVRAFVEELDAPRVSLGMTANIRADGFPGREFKGHVVRLSPKMGRKELWSDQPTERYDTKTREIWIELEENDQWVVGLRLDVTLLIEESSG
ncbi:MAG: HlyD family efflux transporter periplasmic adaptor subunit [Pirellulales bacterium]|nr:HlyD family efflux transporter periplasmic adaptor subunit [Pirellulales bacterium]